MTPIPLLIATTNRKKLTELQSLLEGLPYELKTLQDFKDYREIEETGKSFAENAKLKALGYAEQFKCLTLGEDSGLCCDALDGAPGIYSARFSGEDATDETNNLKLLNLMKTLPDNCRQAHYVSVITLAKPGDVLGVFDGEVHGYISKEVKGTGGFGYDPLFYYPDFKRTFGEVSAVEKHQVSHRAKALTKLRFFLERYAAQFSG